MHEEYPHSEHSAVEALRRAELTEDEIEKRISAVVARFTPFRAEIERTRQANPQREVGGRIVDGKLIFFDESRWEESAVVGESPDKEREMAENGVFSFHTHPDNGFTTASGMDILAAYYRFCETFFHKNGATCLIALKKLPIEEIGGIEKQAWEQAQKDEQESGDPAYWFWKSALEKKLPVKIVHL